MNFRYLLDRFSLALIATVLVASIFPAQGDFSEWLSVVTHAGIAILFFLHGARLSRESVVAAIGHWRLHLFVMAATFVLFPLIGLAFSPIASWLLTPELYLGVLFLCALPSTVQSSIAFTSIARGNIAAAVVAASASNLAGVFLTPLLTALLLSKQGSLGSPWEAIQSIFFLLLAPFVCGQLLQPWIGAWVKRWNNLLSRLDRGTILLIVYSAFSQAVISGLWQQISLTTLAGLLAAMSVLLALVMGLIAGISKRLGFNREDRIALLFCGSKKSLATGVPMANILFAGNPLLGMIVLPVMVFHQIQLIVCAVLAQKFATDEQPNLQPNDGSQ